VLRLPFLRRHRPSEIEIARELRDHLELDADDLVRGGMTRDDASAAARRRFGNVGLIQEEARQASGSLWVERLGQDLRFGTRLLRRSPVFSAIAVACLAIGIGAHAAVLGWTEGIIRHPFPSVRDQERLVAVAGMAKGASDYQETSWPDFFDATRGTTAFDASFVSKITGATLTSGDRAQRLIGQLVSANFFDAVGVRPLLGRGFLPGEDVGDRAHPVTVISYRLWQDHFRGDHNVVGTTINYNGVPHTIIGVTPEAFLGTFVGYAMQFWLPAAQQSVVDDTYKLEDRSARWVEGFARLRPGVTLAAARAQVDAASRRLESEFPNEDRGRRIVIMPLADNPFDNAQDLKPMLRVASIVAALVLVIVCANIANLLLVRALARRAELSARRALGASRWRLTRQLVTEGVLLAVGGTALGIAIAYFSRNALGLFFAPRNGIPLVFGSDFNWRVVLETAGIGLASTVIFALTPAVHATRDDLASAIRAAAPGAMSGGARGRLRGALVVLQICLSVVLLVGAGLMVTSFRRLLEADPGFSTRDVATTAVNLRAVGYDSVRARRFEDDVLQRTREISGVSYAALARSLPFSTRPYDNGPIFVDGYAAAKDEQPTADYNQVTPDFFRTLGITVLTGRDFTAADADTAAPVAIVSRALAQRYWPSVSPIGRRISLRGKWRTVVAVVADIRYRSLSESAGMLLYVPLAQDRSKSVNLFVRGAGAIATVAISPAIVDAFHAIDPNVSPLEVLSMREQVDRSTAGQKIIVTLLVVFSGVAVFLATIGVYGVISYMVSQSTRELGVRMAFGATPAQLLLLVLSSGMRMASAGIVLGVGVAAATTWLIGDLLYHVNPRDPIILMGVALAMAVVATIACLVPAWRAARLDPVRALRA
jgi:predicted permease